MRRILTFLVLSSFLMIASCGNPLYKKISAPEGHQISLSLERTPCLGECPVYKATFDLSDKELRYEGRQFVSGKGKQTYALTAEEVNRISSIIEANDYLGFQDNYDGPITDVPSCITRLSIAGIEEKSIYHRFEGPEKLIEIEQLLDSILLSKLGGTI